jgi:hypothetical protein
MKSMKSICYGAMGVLLAWQAHAAVELPSWASSSGDMKQAATTKGKEVTDLLLYVGAIVAIVCLAIGSIYMKVGNKDKAKGYIFGAIGGLIFDGVIFAVAQWAAK